jgi:phosphoribosylanthranilate isomerase
MMKVKICGMTHPEDAELAAQLGADSIGIIFSDNSKRNVDLSTAKEIAQAGKQAGAEPIGVFIDQSADQIISICEKVGLNSVQLHGRISRKALPLLSHYNVIYALGVGNKEINIERLPMSVTLLFDSTKPGSGSPFDWTAFPPPANFHWILAGGLNPNNVAEAIVLLKPYGVDVATGVEYSNNTRKDPALVKAFINAAKNSKEIL